MFRVFSCLTAEHDLRLVGLAGIVCFLASLAAINLFHRAAATKGRSRAIWLVTAGAASGCGIWATHFIAMLAYDPGVGVNYNVGLTVLSLLLAAGITAGGLSIAVFNRSSWGTCLGGAVVGAGVACMHYLGMWALEMPGHIVWSADLVAASVLLGMTFGAASLWVAIHRSGRSAMLAAGILLTLSIVSHHFTAMGAVEIVADPTRDQRAIAVHDVDGDRYRECRDRHSRDEPRGRFRGQARSRAYRAHGAPRSADELAEPGSLCGPLRHGARAVRRRAIQVCNSLHRSGSIQGDQRPVRTFGRRSCASRGLRKAAHRNKGQFIARLGGDEFTIIVQAPEQQTPGASTVAESVLSAMSENLEIEGQRIAVGVSVGVAIYPDDGVDAATLLSNADAALYRAKAEGRGTIRFFAIEMDQQLRQKRSLQHDLRSAVERGELRLFYQPQATTSGEITGFEALARWQHPKRGMVPPAEFIPIAEESSLIMSIGEWVLREACAEAASWPRPLQIAVNLSPAQFRQGDLPTLVHSILLQTGLSPSRLELEITEGVLIGDFTRALSILRRLKGLGVRIAMDDFGTGYSSLSYLQSFPFDKIKIDRSFIANVQSNHQSAAIVRAVIGLARGLEVPVVAEGVETSEQLAFLSQESCSEIQGYLIGKPSPIASYSEMIGRAETAQRMRAVA